MSEFYDEDQTQAEYIANMQELIDSGMAWKLEGSVGRAAMGLIDSGQCMLGEESHTDFYGNVVPSRTDVMPGTKGSPEFCAAGVGG